METIIQPTRSFLHFGWKSIFAYRDLLLLLAHRDVTVIYKQTLLGPLWFVVQPILLSVVFTVLFSVVARLPTEGVPPFIFYMSGLTMWNYFSSVLNACGGSLVSQINLLSKVYFPRLIVPLSVLVSNLVFFSINFLVFIGFYVYFYLKGASYQPSLWILALPLVVLYTGLVGLGFGLWVAAITTKYRDLGLALPFILQLWMYSSPIFYSTSIVVTPLYRAILFLNPMSVAIEANRFIFLGAPQIDPFALLVGVLIMIVVLLTGLCAFNRVQHNFVDVI